MSRCRLPAVRCEHCGSTRLGDAFTYDGKPSPHASRIASAAVRAKYSGPWPTCRHGIAALADCVDKPIPPACYPHLISDTTS
ncbi:hypothetical protein [Corallococcus carmarthensis]|uniref:hypothetical protein n=1 Tax=Corallococcus carmarthensis TaxID=2316728 RepID=UPI0011C39A6D|nr:hypothetical protein [Corallococcus carmarthensis]